MSASFASRSFRARRPGFVRRPEQPVINADGPAFDMSDAPRGRLFGFTLLPARPVAKRRNPSLDRKLRGQSSSCSRFSCESWMGKKGSFLSPGDPQFSGCATGVKMPSILKRRLCCTPPGNPVRWTSIPQVSSGESMQRKHLNPRLVPMTNSSRRGFLAASAAALGAATLSRPLVLLGATARLDGRQQQAESCPGGVRRTRSRRHARPAVAAARTSWPSAIRTRRRSKRPGPTPCTRAARRPRTPRRTTTTASCSKTPRASTPC